MFSLINSVPKTVLNSIEQFFAILHSKSTIGVHTHGVTHIIEYGR